MLKILKSVMWISFILIVLAGAFYGLRHYREARLKQQTYPPKVISQELEIVKSVTPEVPEVSETPPASPILSHVTETGFENHLFIGFDSRGIETWKEKKYEGVTTYEVIQDEASGIFLNAASIGTSSVIAKSVNLKPNKPYHLSWEWRALEFPDRPNISFNGKEDNDYAIRVYVLFKGLTILTPEVIQYVWDDHYPEGTYGNSPYTKRVKTIVVQHGVSKTGEWVSERHDIIGDYQRFFGKKPKKDITAIAVMSDSDNTKSKSAAQVRNIWLQLPK